MFLILKFLWFFVIFLQQLLPLHYFFWPLEEDQVYFGEINSYDASNKIPSLLCLFYFFSMLFLWTRSRDGTEVYGPVSRFSDGLLQNELRVTVAPADRAAEYKCRGLNLRLDAVVERSLRLDITGQSGALIFHSRVFPIIFFSLIEFVS